MAGRAQPGQTRFASKKPLLQYSIAPRLLNGRLRDGYPGLEDVSLLFWKHTRTSQSLLSSGDFCPHSKGKTFCVAAADAIQAPVVGCCS